VLVHGATHVPVGEDQVQHLEFTRECANNFNSIHGNILIEPTTLLGMLVLFSTVPSDLSPQPLQTE